MQPSVHALSDAVVPTPNPRFFRLIDVQTLRIVQASSESQYITLSYVWGLMHAFKLSRDNITLLMGAEGLRSCYNQLPQTIRDVILLTQMLDVQYVWVDALCVVQDDEDEMSEAVPQMGLIYRNSMLTVIAAAGVDANSSLSGVRKGSRAAVQAIEEVRPGIRMMVLHTIGQHLNASEYRSRGWT
jgi:hypothetical protein